MKDSKNISKTSKRKSKAKVTKSQSFAIKAFKVIAKKHGEALTELAK